MGRVAVAAVMLVVLTMMCGLLLTSPTPAQQPSSPIESSQQKSRRPRPEPDATPASQDISKPSSIAPPPTSRSTPQPAPRKPDAVPAVPKTTPTPPRVSSSGSTGSSSSSSSLSGKSGPGQLPPMAARDKWNGGEFARVAFMDGGKSAMLFVPRMASCGDAVKPKGHGLSTTTESVPVREDAAGGGPADPRLRVSCEIPFAKNLSMRLRCITKYGKKFNGKKGSLVCEPVVDRMDPVVVKDSTFEIGSPVAEVPWEGKARASVQNNWANSSVATLRAFFDTHKDMVSTEVFIASLRGAAWAATASSTGDAAAETSPVVAGGPQPVRRFKYALVLDDPRCFENLYHGTMESALVVFDMLNRLQLFDKLDEVAILYATPAPNTWAKNNIGCPVRNTWPYGVATKRWAGKVMLEVLGLNPEQVAVSRTDEGASGEPLGKRVFFFPESAIGQIKPNPWAGTLEAEHVAFGMPRTCSGPWGTEFKGVQPKWPYFAPGSVSSEDMYCTNLYETFRRWLLLRQGVLSPNSEPYPPLRPPSIPKSKISVPQQTDDQTLLNDKPVSVEERRCPKVVFIKRRGGPGTSGRTIVNFDPLLAALNGVLRSACWAAGSDAQIEVIFLEDMNFKQQQQKIHKSTIVIAARGAGTLNTLWQRRGSGYLSLSIADVSVPVAKDQLPWYPFALFLPYRATTIMNCRAIIKPPPNTQLHYGCLGVSRNFCDMECSIPVVAEKFRALLGRVAAGITDPFPVDGYEGILSAVRSNGTDKLEYFVGKDDGILDPDTVRR